MNNSQPISDTRTRQCWIRFEGGRAGGREGGEETAEEGEGGGATTKEMARRPRWVVEKRIRNVPVEKEKGRSE